MRALILALAACAALGAPPASAQPLESATIGDVLACEADATPGLCLLRAGARGWRGGDVQDSTILSAMRRNDVAAQADPDWETLAMVSAMAEAVRLEAAGADAEAVLAPLAATQEPRRAYRWFASTPDTFLSLYSLWRFAPQSAAVKRLALARWEALTEDKQELGAVAAMYQANGFADEARALIARAGLRGSDVAAYQVAAGNFEAAERAMRASDRSPNPLAYLRLAGQASEGGDHARARRLAIEVLDEWVRGRSGEIIVVYDRLGIAQMAASVLAHAEGAQTAQRYARNLMRGQNPNRELYEWHTRYALALLRETGDDSGACALARRTSAQLERVAEPRALARAVTLELAQCGDLDEARALAARYEVRDFWLAYFLGEPLDANDPPYVIGMLVALQNDTAAGRIERAQEMLRIMFLNRPYFAAETLYEQPALLADWRGGHAFAALRTRLLSNGRTEATPLTNDERDYVFSAALTYLDAPRAPQ